VRRIIAYLARFAVILIGYVVASLAASAFLNILFLALLGYTPADPEPTATASLYFSVPFVALFVAYFAFMPAAVVILIAEVLGRRDWLFYALAGAVVALSRRRPLRSISRCPSWHCSWPILPSCRRLS